MQADGALSLHGKPTDRPLQKLLSTPGDVRALWRFKIQKDSETQGDWGSSRSWKRSNLLYPHSRLDEKPWSEWSSSDIVLKEKTGFTKEDFEFIFTLCKDNLTGFHGNEFAMGTIRLEARHSCHAIISFFSLLCLCGRIQQKNSWHMTLIPRNKPSQTPFRESILFFTNAWILSFGCQNTRRHVLTPRPSLVCNWLWTQHQHLFQSLKIMLIASYTSTLRRNPHLMPWKLKLR